MIDIDRDKPMDSDSAHMAWFLRRVCSLSLIAGGALFLLVKLIDEAKKADSFTLALLVLGGIGLFTLGGFIVWRMIERIELRRAAPLTRLYAPEPGDSYDGRYGAPSRRVYPLPEPAEPDVYQYDGFIDGKRVTLECDRSLVDAFCAAMWPQPSRRKWRGANDGYTQVTSFLASLPAPLLEPDRNGWRWRAGVTPQTIEALLQGADELP